MLSLFLNSLNILYNNSFINLFIIISFNKIYYSLISPYLIVY